MLCLRGLDGESQFWHFPGRIRMIRRIHCMYGQQRQIAKIRIASNSPILPATYTFLANMRALLLGIADVD